MENETWGLMIGVSDGSGIDFQSSFGFGFSILVGEKYNFHSGSEISRGDGHGLYYGSGFMDGSGFGHEIAHD